jgi:hypothetical protein
MRVLVACEFSGTVRDSFDRNGHEAWSCDILETESPGLHYRGDVRHILDGWTPVRHTMECDPACEGWCFLTDKDPCECKCYGPTQEEPELEYMENEHGFFARPKNNPHWDLMVAHPPCTYLSVSGMHWTTRGLRDPKLTEDALDFVRFLMNAPIPRIAIENPVSVISSRIRKPDQVIQPWQFGHDASKATCLWLKNLPCLEPTEIIEARIVSGKKRWANQCDSGQNKLGPSPDRWKKRAEFYEGVAQAMADQWGNFPTEQLELL